MVTVIAHTSKPVKCYKHYDNMPLLYTAIFHGCKNDHFEIKKEDIFLFFAQNIDC